MSNSGDLFADIHLIVVGSLNIDYVTRVEELPQAGSTIRTEDLASHFGGKGANQAISARRQGCPVCLLGAIGDDDTGARYRKRLKKEDIDISHLHAVPCATGAAFVTVDSEGENTIVIAGGANDFYTVEDLYSSEELIQKSAALLLQFEIPENTAKEAIALANESSIPVIVNAAPHSPSFPWQEVETDIVIVNETEAFDLLEFEAALFRESEVRQRIHELRIQNLIVTRGGNSTLVFSVGEAPFEVETLAVLPIDTTGAGDAFCGCFAARIALNDSIEDAVRAANCAGALSTLGSGAQVPIPDWEKVEQHLEQIPSR